jgi:hypothetical protein
VLTGANYAFHLFDVDYVLLFQYANSLLMDMVKEMFSNSGDFNAFMDILQHNFVSILLGNIKFWILAAFVFVTIFVVYISLSRLESMDFAVYVPKGKMLAKWSCFRALYIH